MGNEHHLTPVHPNWGFLSSERLANQNQFSAALAGGSKPEVIRILPALVAFGCRFDLEEMTPKVSR